MDINYDINELIKDYEKLKLENEKLIEMVTSPALKEYKNLNTNIDEFTSVERITGMKEILQYKQKLIQKLLDNIEELTIINSRNASDEK